MLVNLRHQVGTGMQFIFRQRFLGLIPDTANDDSLATKSTEAAEYAIDRKAIAQTLGYGYWEASYQIPARSSPVYNPNFTLGRQCDPDKAKQLLSEAGYPSGFETTIICFAGGLNRDAILAAQAYLTKVGIKAQLEYPEIPKYTAISTAAGTTPYSMVPS
jgi:peptide/nickel transport system substrate-binding protein